VKPALAALAALFALPLAALAATPARDPVVALKEQARQAAARGENQVALRRYQQVVRLAPRDFDARLRLGELYAWTHDLDHSIAAYRDLLALDPANLRAKTGLARVLRWSHRYADAQRLYAEVLEAAPQDADALEGLAHTYALAGDFPGSLALLDRALARSPGDLELLALKGTVLGWQGRFDQGLQVMQQALDSNPRSPAILRGMGDVCMWKRDFSRAVSSYRRALELDPTSVGTALDLAAAYEGAGLLDQAEDAVKGALRQAPDHRKAMEMLQRLRRRGRWSAAQWWRGGLEGLTHAGLPLALAFVLHRRRQLVRHRSPLYRIAYRILLPALSVAWIAAFLLERQTGDWLFLRAVELLVVLALALAVSSRFWEAHPGLDLGSGAVLAVGAHPDDIELGAGGLLLRLKDEGARVYGLVMSEGEKGGPERSPRAEEARLAGRRLGLHGLWVLDFADTRLRDHIPDMRAAIETKITELGVGLVLTHSFRETHGDHVAVFEAAKEAARHCSLICFETVSTPPEFVPNYFTDITSFLVGKLEAVAAHRSQADKPYMEPDAVRARAAHRGLQVGVPYAEAFWVYRWVR